MSEDQKIRHEKLTRFLNAAVRDHSRISSSRQGLLFIEALCSSNDPVALADLLTSHKDGLSALRKSIQQDLSLEFCSEQGTKLLEKFSDPSIATIDSGQVLSQIIRSLVEPSFFWNKLVFFLREKKLQTRSIRMVAWLLSEILRLLPKNDIIPQLALVKDEKLIDIFASSNCLETRNLGQKIRHLASSRDSDNESEDNGTGPGGRHDNDFRDIRDIRVLPTGDELLSTVSPFMRTAAEVYQCEDPEERRSRHVDNLFRLLREDMIHELRDEVLSLRNSSKTRTTLVHSVSVVGFATPNFDLPPRALDPCKITLEFVQPLPGLERLSSKQRKKWLDDKHGIGSKVFRNESLVMLSHENLPLGFGTIHRDVEQLSMDKPRILLSLDPRSLKSVLTHISSFRSEATLSITQINTAIFAYEPFLRKLQTMSEVPLSTGLLDLEDEPRESGSDALQRLRSRVDSGSGNDLQQILGLDEPAFLDESQHLALSAGLSKRICNIQGPPGTGKSYIGALITRALYNSTTEKIMVVCFTNHALDQFLEDLLDHGIPPQSIVRLGSKSSPRTEQLAMRHVRASSKNLTRHDWRRIDDSKQIMEELSHSISKSFSRLTQPIQMETILEYLEFLEDEMNFYDAFQPPTDADNMTIVDRNGRPVKPLSLLKRWSRGATSAGEHAVYNAINQHKAWNLSKEDRSIHWANWTEELRKECLSDTIQDTTLFNENRDVIQTILNDQDIDALSSKRIVACTSTFAAKASGVLSKVSPEVVILEEAGELLEAHVVATLTDSTKQLIMIGDHKQLRPKTSHYDLTVEKEDGYDLNRSLFERLVINGFPHVMLQKQHRMRPEISKLVRHLTYPSLEDAPSTHNRKNILGLQSNVIFVDHRMPETSSKEIRETRPGSSKENEYEARLVLKYVKYLAQQGYLSEDIVVLTPYLGQLRLLSEILGKENDPVLNDMDNHDLYKAGLVTAYEKSSNKRQVHLSSIDNYQGEEKKIVIASLTRSNPTGDIGFMAQPERLNVLLSRARDGLIVVGNFSTFTSSKKGGQVWKRLLSFVKENGYLYSGLPIYCQSHPKLNRIAIAPDDFSQLCPDGGCTEPCQILLSCSKHKCPSRCHILVDHSKVPCREPISEQCSRGHTLRRLCSGKATSICHACEKDDQDQKKRNQKLLEKQQKEYTLQVEHDRQMDVIEEEINAIQDEIAKRKLDKQRENALKQRRKDLEIAKTSLQSSEDTSAGHMQQSQPIKTIPKSDVECVTASTVIPDKDSSADTPTQSNKLEKCKRKWDRPVSKSKETWENDKMVQNQSNPTIDALMDLVGLEDVKRHILNVKAKVEVAKRQNIDRSGERYHVSFLGNPGTGKTTVARLWAKLLHSLEVLPESAFEETTGSSLAAGGIPAAQKCIEKLEKAGGGVFFIDEAYQLTSGVNSGGKSVLDYLLAEIEDRRDKIAFVFAGYKRSMETFFAHNPGISSRIPLAFEFVDYNDRELLEMLQKLFARRFKSRAKIEDGIDGLYMRIVVTRLSRQRGNEGFGNMRDLENIFSRICDRQSERITKARRAGAVPDDLLFTKDDLIGPEPSSAIFDSETWVELQNLVGLQSIKDEIKSLVGLLDTNYNRELEEKKPLDVSLNRVFLGSPGTGKTSVAKLYGRLLASIGMLSNGDVVCKTPADFIGSVIGGSEENTSQILESSKGKVLIIDEAYMLDPGQGEVSGTQTDPFRTAVIDTIVSQVHNVPGDDRCILLLGYEDQMRAMYRRVNPGFTRRFPLDSGFKFEDFSDEELRAILEVKLKGQDLTATEQGKDIACGLLSRARNQVNFGNAGEVENLISKAKLRCQKRLRPLDRGQFELEARDFDPDFDRAACSGIRLSELFKDTVGQESLIRKLKTFQNVAVNARQRGLDTSEHIPTSFIFKGPPGTGKTTTARKIGQVYFDMGILSSSEVVECSASDLIAPYVGQTALKTSKLLETGLGKVLFVDEAYRLAEGGFASEAINELVDLLTKPKFKGRLIVVLAGYEDQMNDLMRTNPGLASRFPETVSFESLTPTQCMKLLSRQLTDNNMKCPAFDGADITANREIEQIFQQFTCLKYWGNGRDVKNLGKKLMRSVLGKPTTSNKTDSEITSEEAISCLRSELAARRKSDGEDSSNNFNSSQPSRPISLPIHQGPPPPLNIASATNSRQARKSDESALDTETTVSDGRDAGVSDATWNQLQADIASAEARAKRDAQSLSRAEQHVTNGQQEMSAAETVLEKLEWSRISADGESDDDNSDNDEDVQERLRQLEAARLARAAKLAALAAAKKKRDEELKRQAEERKKEAQAQAKLREMGVCCMGFRWIKQSTGYRCAGGSHFISNQELDL